MHTMRDVWLCMNAVLRSARQIVNAELEPLRLTSAEGNCLYHLLAENGGLTQEMLAERLDVGKAAVSRTVDALVRKRYVRRARRPGDARAYLVTLTDAALEAGGRIRRAYDGVYELARRGIAEEEFQRFAALLGQVAENLQTGEAAP